jgi:Phosphotransferase enzyme family
VGLDAEAVSVGSGRLAPSRGGGERGTIGSGFAGYGRRTFVGAPEETMLDGGRTTSGVVRIGDTVRRPRKANSDFVRCLLAHLAVKGFEGVPKALGSDEAGREVFSFIEGEVPRELAFMGDPTLSVAAGLIRKFHDLSIDLVAQGSQAGLEVVCHNDLSPCNFVFRAGLPVAIIDFDAAEPGTRAHDLGYAAWLWLNIGSSEIAPIEQKRRLRLFVAAYGGIAPNNVLSAMMARQSALVAEGHRKGNMAMSDWAARCLEWTRRNAAELMDC